MEREMRNNNYNRNIAREARLDKERRENDKPKTQKQKAKERKQRRRRIRLKVALAAVTAFLSGAALTEVKHLLLNPPVDGVEYDKDEQETEVNLDEIKGTLSIEGSTAEQFRRDIASKTISDDAQRKAAYEVDNAKNKDQVLDIVKAVVKDYLHENSFNGKEIRDVEFNKTLDQILYKDVNENGDEIIRYDESTTIQEAREQNIEPLIDNTVIEVKFTTDDGKEHLKRISQQDGEYHIVYGTDEAMTEKDVYDVLICDIGEVVQKGVEHGIAMEQEGNGLDARMKYEAKFKESLAKYYDEQINDAIEKYTSIPENENQIESEKE